MLDVVSNSFKPNCTKLGCMYRYAINIGLTIKVRVVNGRTKSTVGLGALTLMDFHHHHTIIWKEMEIDASMELSYDRRIYGTGLYRDMGHYTAVEN